MEGGSSPLGQFVILAQGAQGKACEALVRQALDHSGVFVFGELLDCANVKALEGSPDGAKLLELLRIFAYGTYPDYKARSATLPELTAAQRRKLQLLTAPTGGGDKYIQFADLQAALGVDSPRELEDLIIDAVYQGLVVGKMDQEGGCLIVESCACRDCRDQDIDYIIETLAGWHDNAQKMLGALDGMVQYSHSSYEKHTAAQEELEKLVKSTRERLEEGATGVRPGGDGGGGCTRMSTDDADEESKRAKSTRGRWMGGRH
ncbi:unnamed protein product [Prorocentrum cordatum]|uniref:PCI domain-containing protein n=1 Tax=Prorocentrum cordatum TaxID=2364126 RepID=A0ABN9TCD5_9DINO|nr:unnamed protein product [Polarella glacialis]